MSRMVTLAEICNELSDGLHAAPVFDPNGEYLFVNANNMVDGRICDIGNGKRADASEYEKYKIELDSNTIFYSIDGTIGNVAKYHGEKVILGKGACYLRLKQDVSRDFIYYLLKSDLFAGYIKTMQTGSTIHHISLETMRRFSFDLPDYNEQELMVGIPSLIDEKLHNNVALCADLESMAKLLYDYWFVQFDFPDENGNPYKSSGGKMVWNEELKREIPDGWEVKSFGDILSFVKGRIPDMLLDTPSSDCTSPYITIDVANNGLPQYCNPKSMIQCNGEVIMVMDGAASGDVYLGNVGSLGSTFSMLTRNRSDISNAFIYMLLKANMSVYKKANTGSTVPHANRSFIENMLIALPKDASFASAQFDLLFKKIDSARVENQQLESLRDFLLPMLMNGQVKAGVKHA